MQESPAYRFAQTLHQLPRPLRWTNMAQRLLAQGAGGDGVGKEAQQQENWLHESSKPTGRPRVKSEGRKLGIFWANILSARSRH